MDPYVIQYFFPYYDHLARLDRIGFYNNSSRSVSRKDMNPKKFRKKERNRPGKSR